MIAAFLKEAGVKVVEFYYSGTSHYDVKKDQVCVRRPPHPLDPTHLHILLHEAIHWTGAKSRLARKLGKNHDTPEYAHEELVAEIGAALLCRCFALARPIDTHVDYLTSYGGTLPPGAFDRAAVDAERAVHYLFEQAGWPLYTRT